VTQRNVVGGDHALDDPEAATFATDPGAHVHSPGGDRPKKIHRQTQQSKTLTAAMLLQSMGHQCCEGSTSERLRVPGSDGAACGTEAAFIFFEERAGILDRLGHGTFPPGRVKLRAKSMSMREVVLTAAGNTSNEIGESTGELRSFRARWFPA
jgi:hypothetical protein